MVKKEIKTVCVYCASSPHINQKYLDEANLLGRLLAARNISVITGAGSRGLMNSIEEGVLSENGKAIGIIPKFMVDAGWLREGLSETIITADIHERKSLMAQKSDAAIALPGSTGTMEELMELITWKMLGLYHHPIVILNTSGYYDPLFLQLKKGIDENFMNPRFENLWSVAKTPQEVVDLIFSLPDWDPKDTKEY